MDIYGKNVKIWRKDFEGRNGTFYRYSVGISSKNADGTYGASYYMDIKFTKKSGAPEKIKNGANCDFEGFLSSTSYTNKDGKEVTNPQIVVTSVDFQGDAEDIGDSFEQLEEQIPF
jgi:single-stranded DNA-binding protein